MYRKIGFEIVRENKEEWITTYNLYNSERIQIMTLGERIKRIHTFRGINATGIRLEVRI
jgi:hypothetical protein